MFMDWSDSAIAGPIDQAFWPGLSPATLVLRKSSVKGKLGSRGSSFKAAAPSVAEAEEAGEAAALGLVGVDGEGRVTAAARMGDIISAAADAAAGPSVNNIKNERGVHGMVGCRQEAGCQAR